MKKLVETISLKDKNILIAVIINNMLGGYYLNIFDNDMKFLFTFKNVSEYADFVRMNKNYIDKTLWMVNSDVLPDIQKKVQYEAMQQNDIFQVENI